MTRRRSQVRPSRPPCLALHPAWLQTVSQRARLQAPVPIDKYPSLVRELSIEAKVLIDATPKSNRQRAEAVLGHAGLIPDNAKPLDQPWRPVVPTRIPVVGTVSGDPDTHFVWEELEGEDPIDFLACRAVRVKGDSMSPVAWEGQFVIYHPDRETRDGDLAVIRLKSGETLFKRVFHDSDNDLLICESVKEGHRPRNIRYDLVDWINKVVGVRF